MTPQEADAGTASKWRLQRRAEFEIDQRRNDRLGSDDPERRTDVEPLLRLGLTYQASDEIFAFLETEALIRRRDERGEDLENTGRIRINQAYVALDNVIDRTRVRVGRWLYSDERDWLLDESIDGALVRPDLGRIEFDVLAGRINHWRRDLLDSGTRGDPVNVYAAFGRYELWRRFEIGAYALVRHDTSGIEGQHRHFGVRAHGRIGDWDVWNELGLVTGHDGRQRLRGHGLDIGGVYTAQDLPMRPRLVLGYAYGSGDDKPDDGVDRRFRQTGLQSNEARLGGLTKRKIYGEVLDPELSNLHVVSAGVGISPSREWSVDLIWHGFRQARIGELEGAGIRPRRDSLDGRGIGHELNLVVGYAPTQTIVVGGALGVFLPSARFDTDDRGRARDPGQAVFGRIEIKVRF